MADERHSPARLPTDRELASVRPLFAAGFVTAFGAHSIAANLTAGPGDLADHLLALGVLLGLYDGAEVLLKPVFGSLADRIGARPVLLGGLVAFAVTSAAFVVAGDPTLLGLARFAQGAAAAAFSPSAGTIIARLAPDRRRGRAFGSYGAWKGLGYALGPLLGGGLVAIGGYPALFLTLAGMALAATAWAIVAVPALAPLPRARQTVLDLIRRLSTRTFVLPTLALASSTAALATGVGFLPILAARAGLGPVTAGAAVSVLATVAALGQPCVGRAHDTGCLPVRVGVSAGEALIALGVATPLVISGLPGLLTAAFTIGLGIGLVTPLAFTALAEASPPERLGQTMGSAEIGRELGDAGGPVLVGALGATLGLGTGLVGLAALVAVTAVATTGLRSNGIR